MGLTNSCSFKKVLMWTETWQRLLQIISLTLQRLARVVRRCSLPAWTGTTERIIKAKSSRVRIKFKRKWFVRKNDDESIFLSFSTRTPRDGGVWVGHAGLSLPSTNGTSRLGFRNGCRSKSEKWRDYDDDRSGYTHFPERFLDLLNLD